MTPRTTTSTSTRTPTSTTTTTSTTRIEVRASDVAALGEAMSRVAADLQWHALAVADRSWALGHGHSAVALADVLGDFEHQRLMLGRVLDDLASGAREAGALYVEVDQQVAGLFDAGAVP
ncbi:MAG: hypothetical protein ABIQ13_03355 [Pedococcus sp.]